MKIGSVTLENQTILAPLAGITNLPFRLLAKEAGCALVCSEMVSAHGLVHKSDKTERLMDSLPEEKPLSVQIFGSDPEIMAGAAGLVESSGADIVDINFGCSVRKIVKNGSGVALMKSPKTAEALIKAIRNAVRIPLTIKIRTGWDSTGNQAFEISEIAEACGVDAITLHPRTVGQGFGGRADWSLIARIKKRISLPVIGNGDIVQPEHAIEMQHQTGCDAVMIGRAAIGTPWIFSQILALVQGDAVSSPDLSHRFELMIKYLQDSVMQFGEQRACRMMRSRLGGFVKGLRYSSRFRDSIKQISTETETMALIRDYRDFLQNMHPPRDVVT